MCRDREKPGSYVLSTAFQQLFESKEGLKG